MTDEQSMYGVETNPEGSTTAFWAAARRVRAKLLLRLRDDRGSALTSAEEDRQPLGGIMPAVETLLTLLIEDSRNVGARMVAAGFSEAEIRGAWNFARRAGYVESTGLGQDRLTEAGRARAKEIGLGE